MPLQFTRSTIPQKFAMQLPPPPTPASALLKPQKTCKFQRLELKLATYERSHLKPHSPNPPVRHLPILSRRTILGTRT